MRKSKLKLLAGSFFYAMTYFAQSPYVVTYTDYLKNVMDNNPLAQRAENFKTYGELQYKAAKGNFDPQIGGSLDQKFFNGKDYYSIASGGVKVPLFTAQNLKFGYEYGAGAYINPEHYTPSYGLPYLGLEVGLLQGMFLDYRRAEVLKSKHYVGYYSAERDVQLNTVLFESASAYFDWLFSQKQLALNKYFVDLARERLVGLESMASIGEKAAVDTIEAAVLYQSRLLDYQNAEIEVRKQSNNLSIFYRPVQNSRQEALYSTTDSLDLFYDKLKQMILMKLHHDTVNNPVIDKYLAFQNVLEIDKRYKKELIKPVLNVNYNFLSYNPNSYSPVYSPNNYKWGVDLAFPLLFRKSRNDYKLSKIVYQNNSLELDNKKNELNYKLSALEQAISLLSQQLQIAKKSVEYYRKMVEAEKMKFDNGESSLFLLNTRESKWLESELKFAEYKLKFIKTALNIIYLKGSLNYSL